MLCNLHSMAQDSLESSSFDIVIKLLKVFQAFKLTLHAGVRFLSLGVIVKI